jgi:ubiquinone biosynthesis protein
MHITDLIVSLPLVALAARLSGRLIGLRQRWLVTIAIGVAGWLLGATLANELTGNISGIQRLTLRLSLALVFMVLLQGLLEFLKRPDRRGQVRRRGVVPHPAAAVTAAWRRSRRYSQIVQIARRNGLRPHLSRRRCDRDAAESAGSYGHSLRLTLEEAGGTFVKLGQMLSTRTELLPPDVILELSSLQDHVPPAPPEEIIAFVEEELGRPLPGVFRSFERDPIGAGSIAQVHAATLIDGRDVVVKIQRPGIDRHVERDLDALLRLARAIERRAAWARPYQLAELIAEFAARVREELDFRREAMNTAALARNLAGASDVRVPVVYEELSGRRVLTLERLRGISVREPEEITRRGFSPEEVADILLGCYLQQLLVDGHYHADPHPGNVLVLDERQIGLIDFGAVGHLDAMQQEALKEMLLAIARRDPEAVLTAVLDVVDIPANADLSRLQHALASYLARHATDTAPSVGAFTALLRILVSFGVYVPPEFSTLFRALTTLQGTVQTLSAGYDFPTRLEAMALESFRDLDQSPLALQGVVRSELERAIPQLRRLPRHIDRIATLAERGDLRLRVSLFSTATDVQAVTRLVNRAVLAGLGVGIAIVAVGLLRVPSGPDLGSALRLYPLLGGAALLTSMILVVRVTVAVLRDGLN